MNTPWLPVFAEFPRLRLARLGLGACVALAACGRAAPPETAQAARSVAATTVVVVRTERPGVTELTGTVVARRRVEVASRLSGFIRAMHVHEGQVVRAGQPLFEVDAPEVQAQVAQARAQYDQARAQDAQAEADLRRYGDLYRAEAIPRRQWEQVQLRGRLASQQLVGARAGQAAARAQWQYADVRAPIAGVVVQRLAEAGDLASPGRAVLVIDGAGTPQVSLQLPQSVFDTARVGQSVRLRAGDRVVRARVAQLVPVADPVSRTYAAKLDLPADAGLGGGQYVQADFAGAAQAQLRVPAAAVVVRAGMTGVFVVDAQGLAHFRLLRLGERDAGGVDVQAGLHGGERVVTDHLDEVENGVRIAGAGRG